MRQLYPSLEILGGINDNVPGATTAVKDGDVYELNGIRITCYHTPCHTRGHILYFCEPMNPDPCYMGKEKTQGYHITTGVDKCVFTGDTIFVGGCGRFFEGSAAEMAHAMAVMRERLPQDTKIFCGHEYSIQNLNFCVQADPKNPAVAEKAAQN